MCWPVSSGHDICVVLYGENNVLASLRHELPCAASSVSVSQQNSLSKLSLDRNTHKASFCVDRLMKGLWAYSSQEPNSIPPRSDGSVFANALLTAPLKNTSTMSYKDWLHSHPFISVRNWFQDPPQVPNAWMLKSLRWNSIKPLHILLFPLIICRLLIIHDTT